MKIDKKIFISVLLVLVILGVMGTVSATESLNNNLTATNTDAVAVDVGDNSLDSTGDTLLGDGDTTIYVDSSYTGDDEQGTEDNPYKNISTAATKAVGGETIFIKNGEYKEDTIKDLAKPLTFTGESENGVIVRTNGVGGFISTTKDYSSLVFNNLVFKDIACTGSNAVMFIGSSGNVNITNCVFDNVSGRYGALRIFSSGSVVIDNCKFLDTKSTTGSYSSAIDFGGTSEYTIKNTIIDGSSKASPASTASYIFGVIYNEKTSGLVTLDNVTITNCNAVNATALIATKGSINIKNSKIMNNYVYRDFTSGGLIWISAGNSYPAVNIETTIIVNNTEPNYILSSNGPKCSYNLSYNNIQNNSFVMNFTNPSNDVYTLDYNYWGSNDQPTGVTVNNWAIWENGEFKLNDGSELAKQIPKIGDDPIGDENTTFVSPDGDDNNTGSADSPVATIAKAVEIAKTKTGEIVIQEGTYTENGIVLDGDVAWSILGVGNVVIDGNASTKSIFTLGMNPSATFTNIKFRNNNPKYGGAIYAYGNSQKDLTDLNVTVNHCTFEDISASSRGGAIYLYYAKGNFLVNDSTFNNCSAGSWGGAICSAYCAYTNGLNLVIDGSTFEECFANNGGCGYLQADTITVTNSVFNNNSANYDSAAMQFYNATAIIDNCTITNNVGLNDSSYSSPGVAIKITTATGKTPTVTITNSIIENNNNQVDIYPAIYVDRSVLDISYSSLINELSIETKDGSSSAVQGVAVANNNWWGTNDPSEKVKGKSITLDKWVIMNVEANVTEALPGEKVKLTVDFNHVNTTAGEIEELTGGAIPKTYKVQLSSNAGTISPSALTIKDGATKSAVYTVGDIYDVVSVSCDDALVEMTFTPAVPPYYGVIYVSEDGDDDNNGSKEAPVGTIDKAIELATRAGGSGQIIINEGSYKGMGYVVPGNLTIAGNGTVVLDAAGAEGKMFELSSDSEKLELINLTLINANAAQYGVIYNYVGAHLILNNVNISNCEGSQAGSIIKSYKGKVDIINCVISDNLAGRICDISSGYGNTVDVTVINSTFKNNTAVLPGSYGDTGYAIIDASSITGNLIIKDSHFINNKGKLGIVYSSSSNVVMDVSGTEFINNNVTVGNGGGIYGYTMTVTDSTFINNTVAKDGGAIVVGLNGNANVSRCKFDNNVAGGNGNAIYNAWKLAVNYCAFVNNAPGDVIYHNGDENVMDANYNWWGTNEGPEGLIGTGTYEGDSGWDEEDCEYDASKWVVMNVNNNYTGESLEIGDQLEFVVDFNHYTDSSGVIGELSGFIPEVDVSAAAIKGAFDVEKTTTEKGVATFIYTADVGGEDTIEITSDKAVNTTLINIKEPVIIEVVYVSPNGDDNNNGSYDHPVATLAHAIDIAERGKIVLFEGTYTINATLVVNKDLNITGEGNVVIDGNLTRIIENNANLNLTNIAFTNAKKNNGAVVYNNGNLTVNACTFYGNTATASTGGSILHNYKGNMIVNGSKFYGNAATRGAINSQVGNNLTVLNSEFYDNDMTTAGNAYGIIYATGTDVIVENTVFRNNKAQNGGAIYATRSTSSKTGSLKVFNCTFENNTAEKGTGGAIFLSAAIEADISNSTFINNTATVGSYSGGQGGAVYNTGTTKATITNSVFIDNYAKDIYNREDGGLFASSSGSSSCTLTISNSVIIGREGYTGYLLNRAYSSYITAENNFWGDNSQARVNATVEKWVIMTATYDNETGALDIAFDKTNSTSGAIADYDDVLPDGFNVTVSSSSGALDETLHVIDGQASTIYTTRVSENITVKCRDAEVVIEVIVIPKIIYVAKDGDDNNTGSRDSPVATIAKAIELADEGKIVILPGTYTTGDLGIISNDLNITGEGKVIIDAQNANRILYVGSDANVVLANLIMINGAADIDSGALLGNSNSLTLINCTLANSSAGIHNGGAIYNAGKLTIINSTIANNTARVGGAIFNEYSAKGTELTIINSTFENNVANGDNNNGGGAIFAQQIVGLTISNSSFIANEALTTSSGGAIGIIFAEADFTIDDSTFMDNHANGQDSTGGGAIYIAGSSNYQRSGSLSISNTLFEGNTADTDGAAIYARATTVDVANSVIFANKDPAGYAVFGYKTDQVAPVITLDDNWWGTNDDPNDFVGGYNYDPTISRWVILTATNDTPFVEGETVKITVKLDQYTDGEQNGTLATPITIPREVFIETTFDSIEGMMENGEFTLDYVVPADLKYVAANVDIQNIELYHVKTATVVEIGDITAIKGETVAINATVKTVDGDNVTGGYVEVYFGDDLAANMTVVDGVASDKVEITKDAGVYNITAKFIDVSGELLDSEANATLEVVLLETAISAVYDDAKELTVTLVNNVTGEPIGDADVVISIGEDNYTVTTNASGEAVQSLADLVAGPYTATVSFNGTDIYAASSVDVDFIVKAETAISAVYDDIKKLTVTLVDNVTGDAIAGADVVISIGDDNYTVTTDDNGQAAQLLDLVAGPYTAIVTYEGNEVYYPAVDSIDFIVKAETDLSVVYDDAIKELTVTLLDNVTGEAIAGADVVISIGDDNYTVTTDDNGEAKQVLDLAAGTYTAIVTYEGNEVYYPDVDSIDFIITDDTSISAVFNEETKELIVSLFDNVTGAPIKGATVVVKVAGTTYKVKINSKGEGVLSLADVNPGTYVATVSYKGSTLYNPSNTTADVSFMGYADISAVYDDSTKELTVTLVNNETGAAIKGASVVVKVDGQTYKAKIDANGEGVVSLADVNPGEYVATVSYKGGAKYYAANTTADVLVVGNTTISAVYDDETKELVATLTDNTTGKALEGFEIVISIDGQNYTVETDANGEAKLSTVDMASGTYPTTVSFEGSSVYNPSSIDLDVIVKYNVTITAVYNEETNEIIVTLTNNDTGAPIKGAYVVVKVGSQSFKVRINATGEGVVSLADVDPGSYDVSVSYKGSTLYNAAETTVDVAFMGYANISAVYDDSTKDLTVTLVNNVTGSAVKGANVVVKVDGKTYKAKIDATGTGKVSLADLAPGSYDASVTYKGGAKYYPANTTAEVVVKQ